MTPRFGSRGAPRWHDRWPEVIAIAPSRRAPETTSVGRLFDAVAALLGVRTHVSNEGQAAIELELLARSVPTETATAYGFDRHNESALDPAPMFAESLADKARGATVAGLAAGFHRGLAEAATQVAAALASTHCVDTVALSGGAFSNTLLNGLLADRLEAAGLRVLQHERLPCNDGGISVGQAAVAASSAWA